MAVVSMRALLETGVHFGHRTQRWHPKMKSFIFTERNGIHIIDLQQTITRLEEAYNLVRDAVSEGGSVLFVGTKRQGQASIAEQAERCGMPFVNQRWLGGTLTNWRTIRQRIDKLHELESQRDLGAFDQLPKHEALMLERQIAKMNTRFGGINREDDFPDLHGTRLVAELAGMVRKYKGRFILRRDCRKSLDANGLATIYPRLFRTYIEQFNWGYWDGYAELRFIQSAFSFTLYLLTQYGDTWRPHDFYESSFLRAAYPASDPRDRRLPRPQTALGLAVLGGQSPCTGACTR